MASEIPDMPPLVQAIDKIRQQNLQRLIDADETGTEEISQRRVDEEINRLAIRSAVDCAS